MNDQYCDKPATGLPHSICDSKFLRRFADELERNLEKMLRFTMELDDQEADVYLTGKNLVNKIRLIAKDLEANGS